MVTAAGTAQVFHLIPLHRSVCPVSKSAANVLCFFISPKYFLLFFIEKTVPERYSTLVPIVQHRYTNNIT